VARFAGEVTADSVGLGEASGAAIAIGLGLLFGAIVIVDGLSHADVTIDTEVSVFVALGTRS